jgi:hypothetical protein
MILGKLGEYDPGETISSEDAASVYEAIDIRLKEIHRLGIFWPNVTKRGLSFTIPANIASASATADILFPITLHVVNGSLDDPVAIVGIREYAEISNKSLTGVPEKALYLGGDEFIFWPIPTASTTAKLVYEAYADDTAASTAPDVEVSMMRWLRDMCAYDLADAFGKPEAMIVRLERESLRAEMNIRKLAVQRVDYDTVMVDDFYNRGRKETDYGWYRR